MKTFTAFKNIVYDKSGIALHEGKEALVSARIGKRMRALGLNDYNEYLRCVREDRNGAEIVCLLDAISTNVTSFFREPDHFEFLQTELLKWRNAGQQRFRIWSTASSTGEEPYSIAMTLADTFSPEVNVKVLATDINTAVLQKAMEARYAESKMKSVPQEFCHRHFQIIRQDGQSPLYAVQDSLKAKVLFRRLNLSRPPFPLKGSFDFIFCRNVMIYFDNNVRKRLLDEMQRLLKPGGYLLVGHAESLTGMMSDFKTVQPSVYVKAE